MSRGIYGGRKIREGTVVSDKPDKTVIVAVEAHVRHPLYKKTVRRARRLMAHDETNEAKMGDRVRIVEARPASRRKRWQLIEVLIRAEQPEVMAKDVDLELLGEVKPEVEEEEAAALAETAQAAPEAVAEEPAPEPEPAAEEPVAADEPPAEEVPPVEEAVAEAPEAVEQPEEEKEPEPAVAEATTEEAPAEAEEKPEAEEETAAEPEAVEEAKDEKEKGGEEKKEEGA